ALREALRRGYAVLEDGGSSLDAVQTAIVFLEDAPEFNAGHGAVFNYDGRNEMDAAIMDGRTLNSGAVASVHHIRNPIRAARLVMERSKHVMLIGEGADRFAESQGLFPVPRTYFHTEHRWEKFLEAREEEGDPYEGPHPLDPPAEEKEESSGEDGPGEDEGDGPVLPPRGAPLDVPAIPDGEPGPGPRDEPQPDEFGTVGAAALDRHGNLAAGTSTGGLTLKRFGRVGDTPIVGAGTYADNESCAVSATGKGEYFIRGTIARDVCALMEMRGTRLNRAARRTIHGKLTDMGGTGGIIAVDGNGNFTFAFNTEAMMRAVKTPYTEQVMIFRPDTEKQASR
ncbi:MAG: isoaspartyl peptidase/L-asparaginase, partial [Alphaproteobacteria bacterium]